MTKIFEDDAVARIPETEIERRYLFVAIDRATRWVFVRIYADQREGSSCDFLWRLYQTAPMKITKLLTDNGSRFTDRFTGKSRKPSGRHAFDKRCTGLEIEHRLAPSRHPQTNGMVERFNGRISEVIRQTRFQSAAELQATLTDYVQTYNHRVTRRALNHRSPVQALQKWQSAKPALFKKRVINHPGLDIKALAYLEARSIVGSAADKAIEVFKLGCANRMLGQRLPEKTRKAGAEIRTHLKNLGGYHDSRHEHLNGSLVIPLFDGAGQAVNLYGRLFTERLPMDCTTRAFTHRHAKKGTSLRGLVPHLQLTF